MKTPVIAAIWLIALAFNTGCKPALTRESATKLVPIGMSEAEVYHLLGTNGSVSSGPHGEKIVRFLFRGTGTPPKVDARINEMGVVFSNGVVIMRQFVD